MKNNSFAFVIHCALFLLAFGLGDTALLFIFSALAGFFPRRRICFFRFFSAAVMAMVLLFVFFRPDPAVSSLLGKILGLGSVHPFVLVAFVTSLTATLTAIAVNRMTLPSVRKQDRYARQR